MKTDWEAVYRECWHDVVQFLSWMLLDDDRARDMAQEAFARVLEIQPDNDRARYQLEQVYQQTERWEDLPQ